MTDLATIDLGGRFWGPVNLRQSEVLIETMDFEPGELKNGSMLSKKRKFSPIVWDGYEVSSLSDNSFSKSCRQSTNFVSTGSVQISSALFHSSRPQVKSVVDIVSAATDDALSSSLIQGQQSECAGKQDIETSHEFVKFRREGSERLQEQFDDDAGGTRNSWSGGDKYADKSVSHDAGGTHRRWFGGDEYADKSVSHDAGGTRSRWSGGDDFADKSESHSAGVPRSRWSGGDEDADKKLDEDHNMEANKGPHYGDTSVSYLGGDTGSEGEGEGEGEGGFHDTPETDVPLQRRGNMVQGCRSLDDFKLLNKIGEGTYGVVYKAEDKITGETVALKKIKINREVEDEEGFPLTSLREINILLSFDHPSIINLKEVVVGSTIDLIFMVMEYMEHDLKEVMERKKQAFSLSEVKCLMLQLLEGVKYLHDNWVLHRDLKTSNLLLNNSGELKICDFGMSRQYGSPLKCYTQLVVTLWYRAPELLLGTKQYSTAVDMWSVGCIMGELLLNKPLFNGETEIGQIDKIFRTLGTPNEATWPGFSKLPGAKVKYVKQPHNLLNKKFPAISFTGGPTVSNAGLDLLNNLLTYDPEKRITADAALNHQWFREVPLPKSKDYAYISSS